tara:strand:- start:21 stop:302 length:282 start_codon:yes stop_codon:yes gene_type:complete
VFVKKYQLHFNYTIKDYNGADVYSTSIKVLKPEKFVNPITESIAFGCMIAMLATMSYVLTRMRSSRLKNQRRIYQELERNIKWEHFNKNNVEQ